MIQKNMIKGVTLSIFAVFASNAMDKLVLRTGNGTRERKAVLFAAEQGKLDKKPGDVQQHTTPLKRIVKKENDLPSPYEWIAVQSKPITFKEIPKTKKPSKLTQVSFQRNTYDPELENLYKKRAVEFADCDQHELATEISGLFTPDNVNKQNQHNTPVKPKYKSRCIESLKLDLYEDRGLSSSEEEMNVDFMSAPSSPISTPQQVKQQPAKKTKTRAYRSFTFDGREIVTAANNQKNTHADKPVKQHPEFLERTVIKHEQRNKDKKK